MSKGQSIQFLELHSYDYILDPAKLNALVRDWRAGGSSILTALEKFATWCTGQAAT